MKVFLKSLEGDTIGVLKEFINCLGIHWYHIGIIVLLGSLCVVLFHKLHSKRLSLKLILIYICIMLGIILIIALIHFDGKILHNRWTIPFVNSFIFSVLTLFGIGLTILGIVSAIKQSKLAAEQSQLAKKQVELMEDRINGYDDLYSAISELINGFEEDIQNGKKGMFFQFCGPTLIPGHVSFLKENDKDDNNDNFKTYCENLKKICAESKKNYVEFITYSNNSLFKGYQKYIGCKFKGQQEEWNLNSINNKLKTLYKLREDIIQKNRLIDIPDEDFDCSIENYYYSNGKTVISATSLHYTETHRQTKESSIHDVTPILIGFKTKDPLFVKAFKEKFDRLKEDICMASIITKIMEKKLKENNNEILIEDAKIEYINRNIEKFIQKKIHDSIKNDLENYKEENDENDENDIKYKVEELFKKYIKNEELSEGIDKFIENTLRNSIITEIDSSIKKQTIVLNGKKEIEFEKDITKIIKTDIIKNIEEKIKIKIIVDLLIKGDYFYLKNLNDESLKYIKGRIFINKIKKHVKEFNIDNMKNARSDIRNDIIDELMKRT